MNTAPAPRAPRLLARSARLLIWTTLLLCTQVHAMQRCRIDGRLVFQASPCPQPAPVTAPGADLPRTVAAAEADAPARRSIADVMREREASIRARPAAAQPQPDGARILRDRMGAL